MPGIFPDFAYVPALLRDRNSSGAFSEYGLLFLSVNSIRYRCGAVSSNVTWATTGCEIKENMPINHITTEPASIKARIYLPAGIRKLVSSGSSNLPWFSSIIRKNSSCFSFSLSSFAVFSILVIQFLSLVPSSL